MLLSEGSLCNLEHMLAHAIDASDHIHMAFHKNCEAMDPSSWQVW